MKRLLPAVALSILVLSALAGAQDIRPPRPEGPDRPPRPRAELREKMDLINLTAEQRDKMETLRTETLKKIIPIRSQIELKQIDLRTQMKSDKPNESSVLKLAREINDLEYQIKELELKQRLAMHSILTAEQREKLREPMPPPEEKED